MLNIMLERRYKCKHFSIYIKKYACILSCNVKYLQASNYKGYASMADEIQKHIKGQAGGVERAKVLSPDERRSIARHAAIERWRKLKETLPEAVKHCVLEIGDVAFDCYLLKDRRRLISQRGMARALGMKSAGGNVFKRALSRKALGSEIQPKLREKLENPIFFKASSQDPAHGYEATVLIEVCDAIWEADRKGVLPESQKALSIQAEIIVRSSAKVGIIALIDEALGIGDKGEYEYRELFREFIVRSKVKTTAFRRSDLSLKPFAVLSCQDGVSIR